MGSKIAAKKVLIMAGGTGGHIFPGLAVADHLKAHGWQVSWLGTAKRMEAQLVPQHGYPIDFIDVVGVRGNGLKTLLLAPFMLLGAIVQAVFVIRQQKPDVVVGFGGFASGPGGIAAWLLRKPLVLHEQNAVAGLTNRVLAKFAKRVLMAFPNTFAAKHQAQLVGNPVRQDICWLNQQRATKPEGEDIHVLIVGGSLGAKVLNDHMPVILAKSDDSRSIRVWHQTGRGNQAHVIEQYECVMAKNPHIRVDEFIENISEAYAWADLVICRAGALTVSEVAAAGVAAIFVPYPHAVDDHQTKNAAWLVQQEAALVFQQHQLTEPKIAKQINALVGNRQRLAEMAANARTTAIVDATEKVADVVMNQNLYGKK